MNKEGSCSFDIAIFKSRELFARLSCIAFFYCSKMSFILSWWNCTCEDYYYRGLKINETDLLLINYLTWGWSNIWQRLQSGVARGVFFSFINSVFFIIGALTLVRVRSKLFWRCIIYLSFNFNRVYYGNSIRWVSS